MGMTNQLLASGFGVGKAAVALQALVAPLQQLFDLKVADLAVGIGQRALQKGLPFVWGPGARHPPAR